jgi:hypothetical protein
LDWGQSAPLVFLQEAAQLVGLGFEATGFVRGRLAQWNGQCRGYRTAGTMTTSTGRSGPCALWAGPAGLDRGESAPLVLLQEATKLLGFGIEAAGLVRAHLRRVTAGAAAAASRWAVVRPDDGAASA